MVVTKENVAAHAIAEHLVALQLPQEVRQLMGRLVGYYEQRRKGSGTPLDRNHHIRQKSLLIGCGGGFLMECGQPYSPVSDWIKQVDLVLEDEGQQYGNMEEAATIARTPRTCFEIWSGDHRQTPCSKQKGPRSSVVNCSNGRWHFVALRNTSSRMGLQMLSPDTWKATLILARWPLLGSCKTEAKPSPGGSNLGRFGRTGGCQGLHPSAEGCCCDPVVGDAWQWSS